MRLHLPNPVRNYSFTGYGDRDSNDSNQSHLRHEQEMEYRSYSRYVCFPTTLPLPS